jgi:hypothetical protein
MNNNVWIDGGWWKAPNYAFPYPIDQSPPALDLITLLLFLAIAACYFVAPLLGYVPTSRQRLALALWLLAGKVCLGLLRISLQAGQTIDSYGTNQLGNGGAAQKSVSIAQAAFPAAETFFLFLAVAVFVVGLQNLTRRQPEAPRAGE